MIETCKSKLSVYLIALIDFFPSCEWDSEGWIFNGERLEVRGCEVRNGRRFCDWLIKSPKKKKKKLSDSESIVFVSVNRFIQECFQEELEIDEEDFESVSKRFHREVKDFGSAISWIVREQQ
jgi:hypothetical protein